MTTLSEAAVAANAPARPKFKVKAHVTRTLLKPVPNVEFYVQPESPIHDAPKDDEIEGVRRRKKAAPAEGEQVRQPPRLMDVINLETGEFQTMIVPVVLETELKRFYKEDSYVGKQFLMVRLDMVKKAGGEGYSRWKIQEIEMEADAETASEPAPEAPAEKTAKKAK